MQSSGILMSSLHVFNKKYAKRNTRKQLMRFSLHLNSSSQSYKGNDMNYCWIVVGLKCHQNPDIVRYWTKRNLWSSSFRFANSFFIGYHILHQFKHLSTLENITTLCFPNICIISPLKAYFDYITKPFVKINDIFSIGVCCCPCSVRKIVVTLKFK